MQHRSLGELQAELAAGKTDVPKLVAGYLEAIAANAHLNAFLEVFDKEATARALELAAKPAGERGRLYGLVLGIKDNIVYQGHSSTAGSKILQGFESLFTATALQRLLDEDAIVIGRLNCDEFAMGSSNENSAYGPVKNPLDNTRVPGGSSGGSAAAVAAGLCHAALGSDTGGSVRQPAAFCGEVGLKPSYGRISRWGLIAYGSSFDQIGPVTHSIEDAALLLEIMAGEDPQDQTSSSAVVPAYTKFVDQHRTYRVGVLREAIESEGLQPEIKAALNTAIEGLRAAGNTVELVDFPYLDYLPAVYYILSTAEASSNLARFDGIRYGYRSGQAADIEDVYRKSRTEGFGEEVKRRIVLGTFVLSSGYYDAYYTKAQKVRRLIQDYTRKLLSQYDVLLCPTTPTTAFKIGEKSGDPIQMYLADLFTVHANLAGVPAISFPAGVDKEGLPIGLQAMADYLADATLLSFAKSVQAQFAPVASI